MRNTMKYLEYGGRCAIPRSTTKENDYLSGWSFFFADG